MQRFVPSLQFLTYKGTAAVRQSLWAQVRLRLVAVAPTLEAALGKAMITRDSCASVNELECRSQVAKSKGSIDVVLTSYDFAQRDSHHLGSTRCADTATVLAAQHKSHKCCWRHHCRG